MTGIDGDKLVVLALDRETGKELWRREVPRRQPAGSRTSTARRRRRRSPTATNVYAFFQDFGLIAFTADGKELWRMPLGPFNMFYGFGASPILVDGTADPAGRSGHRLVPARRRCEDRQAALQGRSPRRHLRLFDADGLPAEGRRQAGPDPRVVPALRLRRQGRPSRVVGARPRVRDEVGGQHRRRHGVDQRLGLLAEPAGHAGADDPVGRRPEGLRQERRRHDRRKTR